MDPRGGARVNEVYRRKKKQGKKTGRRDKNSTHSSGGYLLQWSVWECDNL